MKTLFLILLIFFTSCAATQEPTVTCPPCAAKLSANGLLELARVQSVKAQESNDFRTKAALAGEGLGYAQFCLNKEPQNAGCLYYRAVNRGLWIESNTGNVANQLQKMMADFNSAIQLNPTYDHGGAYRALGYVYLKLPALPIVGDDLHRDIDKAQTYADEALRVDDQDAENLKFAGEAAYAKQDFSKALTYFKQGLNQCDNRLESPVLTQKLKDDLKRWTDKAQRNVSVKG